MYGTPLLGRRLKRYELRTPYAHTLDRLAFALLFQKGLVEMPCPVRVMCSTLPDSRSRFCARRALSSTKLKCAPSPVVTYIVPSVANLMLPTECDGESDGMQSAPAAKLLHELPTCVPRITDSVPTDAVS